MFFAIRYMAFSPEAFQNLHQVSFLYMDRIVEPDPYFLIPFLSAITTYLNIRYNRSIQTQNNNTQAVVIAKLMYYIQYTPFLAMFILGTYPAILNMYWWSVAFTNLLISYGSNSNLFKKLNKLDKPIPGTILFNEELKKEQKNLQVKNAFLMKENKVNKESQENEETQEKKNKDKNKPKTILYNNKQVKVFKKKQEKNKK